MKGNRSSLLTWADARQEVALSVVRLVNRMTRVAMLPSPAVESSPFPSTSGRYGRAVQQQGWACPGLADLL